MKVLLYTEGLKALSKSGLGKAIKHQMRALEENNIEYSTDINDDDYDILHINYYGPKSYLYAKKAKKEGKKIIYHAHSTEEDFRNSFIGSNLVSSQFKQWLIKCYSLGDMIITPTPYSKKLLEGYGIDVPIVSISNGVDTKFFKRDEKEGVAFRKKYNFKDTDKVIMGVGLYIERKGIIDFVELAKRMPEYKFIWFGHSPLAASPAKVRKAVTTKLDNLYFPGYVEPIELRSAYAGADLFIFPTFEETEGIPILEACSMKTKAIIRDIGVFNEWLEDKVNVYKAKDIDDFEIKIKEVLENKLEDLTDNGYIVAKDHDIKKVGVELIETYKKVLEDKR